MVTITLNIGSFFLMVYILLEFLFYFVSGVGLLQKIIIKYRLLKELNKMILDYSSPNEPYWFVKEINTLSATYNPNTKDISIYVRIENKLIPDHRHNWTNDFVLITLLGKIKETSIIEQAKNIDEYQNIRGSVKEFSREEKLKKLGI